MIRPGDPAVRAFKERLHALYVDAGRPALTTVVHIARMVADEVCAERRPTRSTVAAILRADAGQPLEADAVNVGSALARLAGLDPSIVGEEIRRSWGRAYGASRNVHGQGRGVSASIAGPLLIGVHSATAAQIGSSGQPTFLRRPHDDAVAAAVDAARAGKSRVVALVGTPCSGRSRSAWEALRTLPSMWRVWQPETSMPVAHMTLELAHIGPHTIVWLADAGALLDPDVSPNGQLLASALRAMTDDPDRAPVLLVLRLWPQQWAVLTARPLRVEVDVYLTTRSLLQGNDIAVPETLTGAGSRGLLQRYQDAPRAARAVVDAAIDARRFGFPPPIPGAFLRHAAASAASTTDQRRSVSSNDVQPWDDEFAAAIDYATTATRSGEATLLTIDTPTGSLAGQRYRLNEYLLYVGTMQRTAAFPSARFWDALALTVTDPETLLAVGTNAERRGRFGRAGQAYQCAIEHGDTTALVRLALLREQAGDRHGADRLAIRASEHGDRTALTRLAIRAEERGDDRRADSLARSAAMDGDVSVLCTIAERHPGSARAETLYWAAMQHATVPAAGQLALIAHARGDSAEAEWLARRAAASGDSAPLGRLVDACRHDGNLHRAEELAVVAATQGRAYERRLIGKDHRRFGKRAAVESFLRRSADNVGTADRRRLTACLGTDIELAITLAVRLASRAHIQPLRRLAIDRQRRRETIAARRLASAAARCGDPSVLADIAVMTLLAGDQTEALRLAVRAAACGDSTPLRKFARFHRRAGDVEAAKQLLEQAVGHGDPQALFDLGHALQQEGDFPNAEALYRKAAEAGVADAAGALARLLQDTDLPTATLFAQRAAALGHPAALRNLGRAREGAGDLAAACVLYRRGSNHGDDTSAQLLAHLWDRQYHRSAVRLATRAAERGDPAPLRHLARVRAHAGQADEADALLWTAYEHGDTAVLLQLPHIREDELGNHDRAEELALSAVDGGHRQAVADLCTVRELNGDVHGVERLCLRAITAGLVVDLRHTVRLRLNAVDRPPDDVVPLFERAFDQGIAGAGVVLARWHLAHAHPREAVALCLRAANLGEPAAVPELIRLNRVLGDARAADLIERNGLSDDGTAAPSFLW